MFESPAVLDSPDEMALHAAHFELFVSIDARACQSKNREERDVHSCRCARKRVTFARVVRQVFLTL